MCGTGIGASIAADKGPGAWYIADRFLANGASRRGSRSSETGLLVRNYPERIPHFDPQGRSNPKYRKSTNRTTKIDQ